MGRVVSGVSRGYGWNSKYKGLGAQIIAFVFISMSLHIHEEKNNVSISKVPI